jgi:hypothetical protein
MQTRGKNAQKVAVIVCLVTICCLLGSFPRPSRSQNVELATISFYSSETNINNFKSLKLEFDTYLSQFGDYKFQPFNNRETFETYLNEQKSCITLLSSWHFALIRETYHLRPILVGLRNQESSQKSVLVAREAAVTLDTVKNVQIASASSIEYTKNMLKELLPDPSAAEQSKILTVPKELDALMSLGFGMAKAAVTTAHSLEQLQAMNPVLYKSINVLAESKESLLLILAISEDCGAQGQNVSTIIQEMPVRPNGKKNMLMLGLDNWKPIDALDLLKLEK